MSKPKITQEQVKNIEKLLKMDMYKDKKGALVTEHVLPGTWGHDGMDDLDTDTLCRYLYAPDTVEVQMTVDEQLKYAYDNSEDYRGNEWGTDRHAFYAGMQTALKITGRQTPGVITWEE